MAQTFKNPLTQSEDLQKVPPYNKEATIKWLENYGDFVTDDAYESWALSKGKQLGPKTKDTSGYTYQDQYLGDDEFLQKVWNENHPDISAWSKTLADQKKVKNYTDEEYNAIVDDISKLRGRGLQLGDVQKSLLETYGPEREELVRYALGKWAE